VRRTGSRPAIASNASRLPFCISTAGREFSRIANETTRHKPTPARAKRRRASSFFLHGGRRRPHPLTRQSMHRLCKSLQGNGQSGAGCCLSADGLQACSRRWRCWWTGGGGGVVRAPGGPGRRRACGYGAATFPPGRHHCDGDHRRRRLARERGGRLGWRMVRLGAAAAAGPVVRLTWRRTRGFIRGRMGVQQGGQLQLVLPCLTKHNLVLSSPSRLAGQRGTGPTYVFTSPRLR